jgi:hypothetical protein
MDSVEAVASKRRVLVDALMMCLQRSRVGQVVDAATLRGVLDSASVDLWRERELRLDPVWKMLVAQPGLSADDVAPPLLLFKAYEKELGVPMRLPQQLAAIPHAEQVRLRDALGVPRQDFQAAIDNMRTLAVDESQRRITGRTQPAMPAAGEAAGDATAAKGSAPAPGRTATVGANPRGDKRALALALGVLALAAVALAVWIALRDTARSYDLADVSGSLQLSGGRAGGGSLTATISDGRWDTMSPEERRTAVSSVMDIEAGKGIKVMTLIDKAGNARAIASEAPDGRHIVLP